MLCLSFPSYRFIINWFKKINWNTHSLSRSHCPPFFLIFYSTQFIDLWAGGLSSKIIRRQFSVVFHSGRRSHLATVRIMEKSLSLSPTGSRCHVLYICNWRTQLIFFLGHKPKMEKLVSKGWLYYLTRVTLLARTFYMFREHLNINIWVCCSVYYYELYFYQLW